MKVSNPLIIGASGNMASRYKAILNKILTDYVPNDGYGFSGYECYDIKTHPMSLGSFLKTSEADGFIIATPTATHASLIYELAPYKKPILCEKPIVKNELELMELLDFCRKEEVNLRMINQYAFATLKDNCHEVGSSFTNYTYYNYFKHGDDTLPWDCINILGLSEGVSRLDETSPIWTCEINGVPLKIEDMDASYLRMLLRWLNYADPDLDYIEKSHKKVLDYIKRT